MIKKYLFKVWITALIAAAVIVFILMATNKPDPDRHNNEMLVGFSAILTALYGAVLSIPTFAICYFFFPSIYKVKKDISLRIIISLIAAAGVFVTIYAVVSLSIALIFAGCFFISGLIYKPLASQIPPLIKP